MEDRVIQAEYINGKPKYDYYVVSNQNGQVVKLRFSDNQPFWESPSPSEIKVEYQDGKTWQYYVKNGLTVAQTNTLSDAYGKWYQIDIVITNNSMLPIEFDPASDIEAYSVDKRGKNTDLDVYSYDGYAKKVKRAQNWQTFGVALAHGLTSAAAGYSTSTTNTTTHYNRYPNNNYRSGSSGSTYTTSRTVTYDAAAAYRAQVLSQNRMAEFSNNQLNMQNAIQKGYLKKNTINPGQTIAGYVNIQRIKGVSVYVTLNIYDAEYEYRWNNEK